MIHDIYDVWHVYPRRRRSTVRYNQFENMSLEFLRGDSARNSAGQASVSAEYEDVCIVLFQPVEEVM